MSQIRNTFSGNNGDACTITNTQMDVVATGGTATISTAQAWIGSLSALMTATTTSGILALSKNISSTTLAADLYVYVTAAPSAAVPIIAFFGASRSISVELNANRTLSIKDRPFTTIWTSAAAIPLNTWYRVGLYATQDSTNGTVRAAMWSGNNSTPEVNGDSGLLTGRNTGPEAYASLRVGPKSSTGTQTATMYVGSTSYDTAATDLPAPYGMPVLTLTPSPSIIFPGDTCTLTATATDSDGIASTNWSTTIGTLVGSGTTRTLTAPANLNDQTATVTFSATDTLGNTSNITADVTMKASMSKFYDGTTWIPLIENLIT